MLKGMKFIVFGLGDTSYEQFNVIGKFINEGLEELGGERIYKYGEGNAEGNKTEDDFNDWKCNLWKEIFEVYAKTQTTSQRRESFNEHQREIEIQLQRQPSTKVVEYPLELVQLENNDESNLIKSDGEV